MLFPILNFLLDYLCYFIGGFIQALFILLPVTLKNWEDDALNGLTYIAFQLFVAGMIFIISPWILEVKPITFWMQILLLGGTGIISFFRIIKLIPFEFTYPIKLQVSHAKNLEFNGFNTIERHSVIESLDFQECDAQLRFNAFREKLARFRSDKSASALEEMIRDTD